MRNTHRWLHDQIRRWRAEALITPEQADILSARYPVAAQSQPWGKVIVSAFGAVILGLGVILFFAYNWQGMHRLVKLALVLGALVVAHGTGWWLYFHTASKRLGESLHLLGTVLFGAGIWLVAQIYHIDAHFPNGLLLWTFGGLLMAWALFSTAQGLLTLALIAVWGWFEGFEFNATHYWPSWLIVAGIMPLAWMKRSPVLLFFAGVLLMLSYLLSTAQWDDDFVFTAIFFLAVSYLFAGSLLARKGYPAEGSLIRKVGWLFYLVVVFIFTFADAVENVGLVDFSLPAGAIVHAYLPVVFAIVLAGFLLAHWQWLIDHHERAKMALVSSALVLTLSGLLVSDAGGFVALLFNGIFFGHALVFLLRGMEVVDWREVAVGGAMLAALIFARFMDLFDSLLVRSLAFILLGAGLLLLGWYFSRRKERAEVSPHG